jgi:AbrB family transcriptional regulator (stage V sporulation protein T)
MKATGIVRRIDDLGRVVIPKEIRRTMRIREGDPLEIFTENDGEVIFKKYSPIGEISSQAVQFAESVGKHSKLPIVICDRDHCIAASGISRKEVIERRITQNGEDLLEDRQSYIAQRGDEKKIYPLEGVDRAAAAFIPILSSGDITGAVIVLEDESGNIGDESDVKLGQVAAAFLGKQMEE